MEIPKQILEFKIYSVLGEGSYGTVVAAYDLHSLKRVAIKLIQKSNVNAFETNSDLFVNINHPNIVKVYKIFEHQEIFGVVMEYMSGGTLEDYISRNSQTISEQDMSKIIFQILSGLSYLHKMNIVHSDIKPANILLSSPDNIDNLKIADFGMCFKVKMSRFDFYELKSIRGTSLYLSPEAIKSNIYTKAMDLWAIGIITFRLFAGGKYPFYQNGDDHNQYKNTLSAKFQTKGHPKMTKYSESFFLKLCAYEIFDRYDVEQALSHPWITRIESEIPLSYAEEFEYDEIYSKSKKIFNILILLSVSIYNNNIKIKINNKNKNKIVQDRLNSRLCRDELRLRIPSFQERLNPILILSSQFKTNNHKEEDHLEEEFKASKSIRIKKQTNLNHRKLEKERKIYSFKKIKIPTGLYYNRNISKKFSFYNSPKNQKTFVTKDSSRNNSKSRNFKDAISRNLYTHKNNKEDLDTFTFIEQISKSPFLNLPCFTNPINSLSKLSYNFTPSNQKIPTILNYNTPSPQSNFKKFNELIISKPQNKSDNKRLSKAQVFLGRENFSNYNKEVNIAFRKFTRNEVLKNFK